MTLKSLLISFSVGILFIAGAILMWVPKQHLIQDGVRTTGHVIKVEQKETKDGTRYTPTLEFSTPNGAIYQFTANTLTSRRPSVGTPQAVLYNPNNPNDAVQDDTTTLYIFPGVFFGIGLLLTVASVVPFVLEFRTKRRAKRLKATGQRITVPVSRIDRTSYEINRKPLYRIHAQIGQRTYRSTLLWSDPSSQAKGKQVTIYQNPNNEKDYWLDTDFLTTS